MIVLKLRGARLRQKARTGRCEGAKPYGELPGESVIIERIHGLRASGMGFDRIAEALNVAGIKPRRGLRWYGIGVNKVVTRKERSQQS